MKALITRYWDAVERVDMFQAVCARCHWEGGARANPIRARQDAAEHNEGEHE